LIDGLLIEIASKVTPVSADNVIHSAVSDAHPAYDTLTPSNVCDSTNTYSVTSPSLPEFIPTSGATFTWGSLDSQSFCNALNSAYQEVVNWKSNCFCVPSGKCGKRFVSELARLFHAAGEKSALEGIAIKAALTLCSLVLQKPTRNSKEKHHVKCLERCLQL